MLHKSVAQELVGSCGLKSFPNLPETAQFVCLSFVNVDLALSSFRRFQMAGLREDDHAGKC